MSVVVSSMHGLAGSSSGRNELRSPCDRNPVRLKQPQHPVRADSERMDVELCIRPVRNHDRRRRGDDFQVPAGANPVDMPMPMHDNDAFGVRLENAQKPLPLMRAVPMRSENAATGLGYSVT